MFKKTYLLHSVLFIAISAFVTFDFYILGTNEKLNYYLTIAETPPLFYLITLQFNVIIGPIYVIWSLWILRKYKKQIANNFSYTERINLNWLKYILISSISIWVAVLIVAIFANYFKSIDFEFGTELTYVVVTLTIFFLGFFGFRQPSIYTDNNYENTQIANKELANQRQNRKQKIKIDSSLRQTERYSKSGLKETDIDKYLNKMLLYMENEKPFLDSKLSLKQLAEFMELSTNHTSQIINEKLNKNFFDFINDYRINEVKKYLSNSKFAHYTLLGIAYECGFNSKSSFNSLFKIKTGLTPSEFQKNLTA